MFIKVFPYEYQRALKQIALKNASPKFESNGKVDENGIVDIEEAVRNVELDKKNLEKVLDKTRYADVNSILKIATFNDKYIKKFK